MKQTKEEKVTKHSDAILETLCKNQEDQLSSEYKQLANEYKKLFKRYTRHSKISDLMDKTVISEKNSLEDDKKNIIKISKTKIMDSISNQRKLKDQHLQESSNNKQLIYKLQKELDQYKNISTDTNKKLTKTTDILQKTKTKVQKLEEENSSLSMEVNALKELALPFEELLEKELLNVQKNQDNFVLCMIGIDNFNSLKNKLFEFTTIENFILGILKYLKNSLKKTDRVIYFK